MSAFLVIESSFTFGELHSPSVVSKVESIEDAQKAMKNSLMEHENDTFRDMTPAEKRKYKREYSCVKDIQNRYATLKLNDEWYEYAIVECKMQV